MNTNMNNERGSALLIALLLTALLSLLAISVANQTQVNTEMSFNQVHEDQAFYLAEAGANRALAELNDSIAWRAGFSDVQYGPGDYSVTVTDSSADITLADSIRILSIANVETAKSTVELLVSPEANYPFRNALFGENLVDLRNSFNTDSYDSDSGSYVGTRLDSLGDVGSNGVIDIANGTIVGGDVATSLSGGLSVNPGSTIYGTTTDEAPEAVNLPIPQTEFDWAEINNDNLSGISGTYTLDPSTNAFESTGSVELSTGIYYFSTLTLKNSASLTVAPGAEVTIYVTGDVEFKNASELNTTGEPGDLMILSQGDLVLKNSGEMKAIFYNPEGVADLRNSGDFYGSVVAYDILGHNSAGFHYDRSLGNRRLGETNRYEIAAWKEH